LTLQYDKVGFLLEPNEITRELRRKRVTVVDYPHGRLAIRYRRLDLPYASFDKLRQVSQASIVENKHLGAVLSHIRERQIERAEARSQSAPRRQGARDRWATCSKSVEGAGPARAVFREQSGEHAGRPRGCRDHGVTRSTPSQRSSA
jgi:hypothetical protein